MSDTENASQPVVLRLPELIVAALAAETSDAIAALQLRHALNLSMPAVQIVEPNAEVLAPKARSFGARSSVRRPARRAILGRTLREAINEL